MEKVHLCKSCSETKNCDWYNATPGVGMYECENYVEKLDFSKHICDVCKTIDEKCPRGLKRDDRDIVVTQCSFFDEYKDSIGDLSTNFSSRFMPNVKFIREDISLKGIVNNAILHCKYFYTTSDGSKVIGYKGNRNLILREWLESPSKEVSIYEAIPELVPEDMRYNKELDKLVPDVLKIDTEIDPDSFSLKNVSWDDDKAKPFVEFVDERGYACGGIFSKKDATKEYCDGISLENSIGEVATNFFENKYDRKIIGKDGIECVIDVYDVLKAFEVKCPALQHLIKKALCAGLRGHKDICTDLQDIIDSAARAKELYKG